MRGIDLSSEMAFCTQTNPLQLSYDRSLGPTTIHSDLSPHFLEDLMLVVQGPHL